LIGRYVREKKAIGLLEAIKKITILPAKRFGIEGKGCILEEKDADLVIFDYERIIDKAEYMGQGSPDAPPEGIKYVLVNGKIIVEGNKVTGKLHEGKLLRRI
ncbi:MAG: amidohydrolase family protein, partial [Clostridia bacterium]|nr:amidohydrolase family protein [Clostridia bacterium]